jgi:hypothetical protein
MKSGFRVSHTLGRMLLGDNFVGHFLEDTFTNIPNYGVNVFIRVFL